MLSADTKFCMDQPMFANLAFLTGVEYVNNI